jgi:copper(I)-binding protein
MMQRAVFVVAALLPLAAQAAVTATDAWVRGTVPAQKATGAFLTLTSSAQARLVAVSTPAAKSAQIHASQESGGIMQMHALDAIALPAGKKVELRPGGYHIMLFDLTRALGTGDQVPLTLTIEEAGGKRYVIEVRAEVRPLGR